VQELRVVGVRVELPGNQPILLLKETQGERYLPIWIGAVEAAAIAFEQQGVRPARPMTHDLLREVVRALGATLEAVNITEMRDGIYIAELVFGDDRVVSARPSDAVALAVRTGAPIYGAEALLDEVGIEIPDEQEDEVEKFREFLDQISRGLRRRLGLRRRPRLKDPCPPTRELGGTPDGGPFQPATGSRTGPGARRVGCCDGWCGCGARGGSRWLRVNGGPLCAGYPSDV
jgi:bifunctional DNase/RNase